MKKSIILAMVLILGAIFVYSAVFEIENESEKVLVTMVNQEPDPVAPGNTVDVRFRIENMRSEVLQNVEVKVEEQYPFAIYSGDKIQKIGTLAPKQDDETGVMVKFKLVVDKDAAEGENKVEFVYRANGGAWIKPGDFTIEVRERDAVLAINKIETEKEKMIPGTKNKVSFFLENIANSVLKDIKLTLDVKERLATTTSITYNELPFTPIGSGNEKTVDKIDPGKTEDIIFDLFVDSDAESKVHKVPYILSYSDEAGTNFTRNGYLGLMVDAEPDLSINIDSTTIYSSGTKGTIGIKFVNKGFSDVKFLDIILKETDDFEILSNPEVYIGNLDSDDYEAADYELLVSKDASNEIMLPLKVEYRNANGKLYSNSINLRLQLYSGEKLKQRTDGGGNAFVGVIIVVVIIGAGIWFWRWRKKKKKQK
jgi:hypothetical protein